MGNNNYVISGIDMSGTSTQIEGFKKRFSERSKVVYDFRGEDGFEAWDKEIGKEALPFSFNKNDVSSHIDISSADVVILEEPSKQGIGYISRKVLQNMSKYGSQMDHELQAEGIALDRFDLCLRFYSHIPDTTLFFRSRSEESSLVYQLHDSDRNENGVPFSYIMDRRGNQEAMRNPPHHIFVVCGPVEWDKDSYLALRKERMGDRCLDDNEQDVDFQLLCNERYAKEGWLESQYEKAGALFIPKIHRFSIYDSIEDLDAKMWQVFLESQK